MFTAARLHPASPRGAVAQVLGKWNSAAYSALQRGNPGSGLGFRLASTLYNGSFQLLNRNPMLALYFSERYFEIPFVRRVIAESHPDRVIELGSVMSDWLARHCASLVVVDSSHVRLGLGNVSVLEGDIGSIEVPTGSFDLAVTISTVEHVGLGAYGDPVYASGDSIAIRKLHRSLESGARLILSTRLGRSGVAIVSPEFYERSYDYSSLVALFADFSRFDLKAIKWNGLFWEHVEPEEVGACPLSGPPTAIALVVAYK